ncbi:MAG: hypothetical protein ACRD0O_01195 [Acidimicrobiia bacterium]
MRTTPWGSIDATMGLPAPTEADFSSQHLHGEPIWLKVDALPGLPT